MIEVGQAACNRKEIPHLGAAEWHSLTTLIGLDEPSPTVGIEDFQRIDIRVGRVLSSEPFPQARKPAYKLLIDFGPELGRRRSSAQLTGRYRPEELSGRLVLAVVNFPARQIGPFNSEVLVLGVPDEQGNVVLIQPNFDDVPLGGRLF